jgi:AraC family transcriptional regulator, regulatory protein of adaptative response / DNA-3-methyladenine glycosylase II
VLSGRLARKRDAQLARGSTITPSRQARRVVLEKKLIHDTRMPMAEVALASGFGSIRRFEDTFQKPPRRPAAALSPTADHERSAEALDQPASK